MKEYKYYIVYIYVNDDIYVYGNQFVLYDHKINALDLSDITIKLSKRHRTECIITFFSEVG